MTLALDQNIDNQLLTKFQPKIIENEEEYEQARHLLLNLISKQDRLPEETAMVKLMATIIKDFDAKQPQPEPFRRFYLHCTLHSLVAMLHRNLAIRNHFQI